MSFLRSAEFRALLGRDELKPIVRRYASVALIVAVAVALRFLLDPQMGRSGFILLLAGSLAAAWIGGIGACLVAQCVILMVHVTWFAGSASTYWPPSLQSIVNITSFFAVGLAFAALGDLMRAAQKRMQLQAREAMAQRDQFSTILSCMADAVVVTDAQGRVTMLNPMAESLLATTLHNSRCRPLWEVLQLVDAESHQAVPDPARQALDTVSRVHSPTPLLLRAPGGTTTPIAYSAAPIQSSSGTVAGAVVLFHDETERRRSEVALRDSDRRKDEFLATLAHELRNPLAPICMGLELMKLSTSDEAAAAEVRSMVERQAQHMVRLIDDLLDVSRITRGKLKLRKTQVDLQSIIAQAVESTQPLMDTAGHDLVVRMPAERVLLEADRDRLTQVFSNLLNNAAKYTPPGGRIELIATQHHDMLSITCTDTGRGIPARQLPTIFDMFNQVDRASENGHTGLGIGLALVKRLVEMHGGTVEVQSEGQGRGSTFTVHLPIVVNEKVPVARRIEPNPENGRCPRRVLLVDDNRDALSTMSMMAVALGLDVKTARDGVEAVAAAEDFRPEVILMDLGMPRMNGFDAARHIRAQDWGRGLLLIAVTGWGQKEDRLRTKAVGFDQHLVKPLKLTTLAQVLGIALREPAAEGDTWTAAPDQTTGDSSVYNSAGRFDRAQQALERDVREEGPAA